MEAADLSAIDENRLSELQDLLGVRFKDPSLLTRALTHRSAASEHAQQSNERLEFLGDSIVGLVVCEHLFRLFPNHNEGELAKSKAFIVSENSLATAAQEMGLQHFVVMSPGESSSGGRRRRSILSDVFEAVIGAIYLDRGITTARRVVRKALKRIILQAASDHHRGDYKSSLQERTQALYRLAPMYRVVGEIGEEHDKTFAVEAVLREDVIGSGNGKTKKEAEQSAAHDALAHLPIHVEMAAS
jgi:ribonuclease-3